MSEIDPLTAARAVRRQVLGDAYVDAQSAQDSITQDFQDHLTRSAWGAWARGGPLSMRDRSLLVLAMTAALGRMEEFKLHVSASRNIGVSDAELDELPFQIAGYCGAPAAVAARRAINEVRALREGPQ